MSASAPGCLYFVYLRSICFQSFFSSRTGKIRAPKLSKSKLASVSCSKVGNLVVHSSLLFVLFSFRNGPTPQTEWSGRRWGIRLSDFRVRDADFVAPCKHLEQEQKKRRKCSPRDPEITRVKFQSACQSIFNFNSNDNAENPSLAGSESSSPPEPDNSQDRKIFMSTLTLFQTRLLRGLMRFLPSKMTIN